MLFDLNASLDFLKCSRFLYNEVDYLIHFGTYTIRTQFLKIVNGRFTSLLKYEPLFTRGVIKSHFPGRTWYKNTLSIIKIILRKIIIL